MATPQETLSKLRAVHNTALDLELNGGFSEAHDGFAVVLGALGEVAITEETFVQHTLLRADALRDDAYTSLREGLAGKGYDLHMIERARLGLKEAHDFTAPFVSGTALEFPLDKYQTSQLFGAHAKTEGCEARRDVAEQIASGEITLAALATKSARQAQSKFRFAHKTALGGNSAYAGASNAIHGARTEVVDGSSPVGPHVVEWLRRGIAFTAFHSAENVQDRAAAARTIVHHLPELRSREAAFAAASHWRRV